MAYLVVVHILFLKHHQDKPIILFFQIILWGINYEIKPLLFLDFRVGKRHASNLNFQSPNGGINTFIINIGIMKLL